MVPSGWVRIINIGGLAAWCAGNYIASMVNAAVTSITKKLADALFFEQIHLSLFQAAMPEPGWLTKASRTSGITCCPY